MLHRFIRDLVSQASGGWHIFFVEAGIREQFPNGTALAGGSNIAIVSDGDSEFAVFATNDGSLWTVDLQDGPIPTTAKRLYNFPELASDASAPNPLLIHTIRRSV